MQMDIYLMKLLILVIVAQYFKEYLKKLMNLKLLIIDCLKFKKHETHLNFKKCLYYINKY